MKHKIIIALMSIMAFAFGLNSCSSLTSSPKSVVSSYLDCIVESNKAKANGDTEKSKELKEQANQYLYNNGEGVTSLLTGLADAVLNIDEYEITNVKEEGDITYVDAKCQINTLGVSFKKVLSFPVRKTEDQGWKIYFEK